MIATRYIAKGEKWVPEYTVGKGLGTLLARAAYRLGFAQSPGCGCSKVQATFDGLTGHRHAHATGPAPSPSCGGGLTGHARPGTVVRVPAERRAFSSARTRRAHPIQDPALIAPRMVPNLSLMTKRLHFSWPLRLIRPRRFPDPIKVSHPGRRLFYPTIRGAACDWTSDGSRLDTANKIASASAGQTVCIPAGTFNWASQLAFSKPIILAGQGRTATTILVNYVVDFSPLMYITESLSGITRLEGIRFNVDTGPGQNTGIIRIQAAGGPGVGRPVLIVNSAFYLAGNGGSDNAIILDSNKGVFSGNYFEDALWGWPPEAPNGCLNQGGVIRHQGYSQTGSIYTPPKYGMADSTGEENVYFENNEILNVMQGVDIDEAARIVVRYNLVRNSATAHHGADTGDKGPRYSEQYNNIFAYEYGPWCGDPVIAPASMVAFTQMRGGTMLWHHNQVDDINTGAWYGNPGEIGFVDWKLRRNQGNWPCWIGTGTGIFGGPAALGNSHYPSPHQVGWGFCDPNGPQAPACGGTRTGDPGFTVYTDLEPVYLWANTARNGSPTLYPYVSDIDCEPTYNVTCAAYPDGSRALCEQRNSSVDFIKVDREFVMGPKPGYTPYTYPHPLLSGGGPAARFIAALGGQHTLTGSQAALQHGTQKLRLRYRRP
jgi:hypothetical protein